MAALPAYDVNFRVANVDLKALATAFEPTFNSQAIVTKISKLAFERGLLLEAVARSDGNKFCNLGHTHAALASLHGDGPADAAAPAVAVAATWKAACSMYKASLANAGGGDDALNNDAPPLTGPAYAKAKADYVRALACTESDLLCMVAPLEEYYGPGTRPVFVDESETGLYIACHMRITKRYMSNMSLNYVGLAKSDNGARVITDEYRAKFHVGVLEYNPGNLILLDAAPDENADVDFETFVGCAQGVSDSIVRSMAMYTLGFSKYKIADNNLNKRGFLFLLFKHWPDWATAASAFYSWKQTAGKKRKVPPRADEPPGKHQRGNGGGGNSGFEGVLPSEPDQMVVKSAEFQATLAKFSDFGLSPEAVYRLNMNAKFPKKLSGDGGRKTLEGAVYTASMNGANTPGKLFAAAAAAAAPPKNDQLENPPFNPRAIVTNEDAEKFLNNDGNGTGITDELKKMQAAALMGPKGKSNMQLASTKHHRTVTPVMLASVARKLGFMIPQSELKNVIAGQFMLNQLGHYVGINDILTRSTPTDMYDQSGNATVTKVKNPQTGMDFVAAALNYAKLLSCVFELTLNGRDVVAEMRSLFIEPLKTAFALNYSDFNVAVAITAWKAFILDVQLDYARTGTFPPFALKVDRHLTPALDRVRAERLETMAKNRMGEMSARINAALKAGRGGGGGAGVRGGRVTTTNKGQRGPKIAKVKSIIPAKFLKFNDKEVCMRYMLSKPCNVDWQGKPAECKRAHPPADGEGKAFHEAWKKTLDQIANK